MSRKRIKHKKMHFHPKKIKKYKSYITPNKIFYTQAYNKSYFEVLNMDLFKKRIYALLEEKCDINIPKITLIEP